MRGDKHPQRVLSAEDVRAIRADHTGKHGQGTALARKYGVAKETIYSILSGRSWASVE